MRGDWQFGQRIAAPIFGSFGSHSTISSCAFWKSCSSTMTLAFACGFDIVFDAENFDGLRLGIEKRGFGERISIARLAARTGIDQSQFVFFQLNFAAARQINPLNRHESAR